MKLTRLNLKAVGPFTDVVLDLAAGDQGLHLIYGPNEAGKSSALRALSHLLFGFPHLSEDNFVHPNDQLRVGGTLRRSNGEELAFVRRQYSANIRLISLISLVCARASISRMRAFWGLSVSAGIIPILSYSSRAITRPLPVRLERTKTGLEAGGADKTGLSASFSELEIRPAPVPANTMPLTPLDASA